MNLGSILKCRDIILPTKVHLVKAMVFLRAKEFMLFNCGFGENSWESPGQQNLTSQSKRKLVLNIHWKEWCWSWISNVLSTWCKELTHLGRTWFLLKNWRWEEKVMTKEEIVGWHHWLHGHEFEYSPGVGDRQGSLACCTPWQARSWTWLSNWTEVNWDSWYRVYYFSVYSIVIQVLANKKLDNSFKLVSRFIFLWSYIPKRFFF